MAFLVLLPIFSFEMRRIRALYIFLILSNSISAQVTKKSTLDSLYQVFTKTSNHDTVRLKAVNVVSNKMMYIDADSAESLAWKGVTIAKRTNSFKRLGALYITIGGANFYKGNYSKALDAFQQSDSAYAKAQFKTGRARAMANMGNVFYANKDYKKAIEYYHRAISKMDPNDLMSMSQTHMNLGAAYSDFQDPLNSKKHFRISIEFKKALHDTLGMAYAQTQLMNYFLRLNQIDSVGVLLERVRPVIERSNDLNSSMHYYLVAGQYFLKIKKHKEALNEYYKALRIAQASNFTEPERDAYMGLWGTYAEIKKLDSALAYHMKYTQLKDTLNDQNTSNEITRRTVNIEYEKEKALTQKENEHQLALAKEQEQKQRLITLFTVIGLILLALVTLFIVNRLRITREQKKIIQEQKALVDEKQKEILDSLQYAKQIQRLLLANHALVNQTLPDSFVVFKPKDIVSGDFYWAAKKEDRFYLAVCDSTGHGVPGAFMSLLNINFLNEAINEKNIAAPNEVFNYVRQRLIDNISQNGRQDGMDGILLCVNERTKKVTYAAANNSPVLIQNNELKALASDKMPIGKGERNEPFRSFDLDLKKGDQLYLFTDGYADQFGGTKGKKFKYKPLNEFLLKNNELPVLRQEELLYEEFDRWKGTLEQVDDVCILGFRF
jgi:serine phosphatase RsbU (regulator of sigma subunit)